MDMTRIIGCRYFKNIALEDGNIKLDRILKVIGLQNSEVLKVIDLNDNTTFKINKKELEENYILLKPDAYIMFSIVKLQDNIQDIIISMFRTSDMESGNNVPYCVCRQNITNLYGSMIRTQDLNSFESKDVGMCMSIESIPDGIDYSIMTACNGLDHVTIVASYLDDKLDTILSCIKINKYNKVLESLFQDHVKYTLEDISNEEIHMGYCRTLKSLLENTNFMYDYRRAFGIAEIKICLSENIGVINNRLIPHTKLIIEKEYNKYILDEIVIKYDKDIDIDDIKKSKIIVCDINEDIYLIVYTEGKEYIENVARINSRMSPSEKIETVFNMAPEIPNSFRPNK